MIDGVKRGAYTALCAYPTNKAVPRFHPNKNKSINKLNRERHDYHIGRKTERRP